MIQICAVGGYNEVGKNCTAIRIDDNVLILDVGLHLENYIRFTEDEDIVHISEQQLMKAGAIPDINVLGEWKKNVKAIIIGHAHLDHIGAVPYLASHLKAPIIATPYSISVLKEILKDEKIKLKNKIKILSPNSSFPISKDIKIEFVHITHSIPQTVIIAIHSKYGILVYANDFKFDFYPTLGKTPNIKRLEEIGMHNVLALIVESTYASDSRKMPSEAIAKQMLEEVLLRIDSRNRAIIITTFSSHLARLKSIIEFGKRLKRKIIFLGRSLSKYVNAGEHIKIIHFTKDVEIVKYSKEIKKRLKRLSNEKEKYLLVVTGHQGEPKSVLSKIASQEIEFSIHNAIVIFSCKIIPTPTNQENREKLEQNLKSYGVRIFKDIHVSGHAAREDLRDLITILKPKNIIPTHGTFDMKNSLASLAEELGYEKGENIYIIDDGEIIDI